MYYYYGSTLRGLLNLFLTIKYCEFIVRRLFEVQIDNSGLINQ